ncbi:MAG: sulfatase family protein [Planctomycetota bacterium]|jgi:arylsulfatase A-like enzyme
MNKPNILVIFADQMPGNILACQGDKNAVTPNFDAFAKKGSLFKRAISNTPLCTPARASLLTGRHVFSHKLVGNDLQLSTEFTSIAHALNAKSYKCGYIGKWHLDGPDRDGFTPPGPRRQGFDDFWAVYNCNHDYYASYYYLNDNPEPVWNKCYEPVAQTDLAIDYMKEKAAEENPFCLFLSWGPPHTPVNQVPQKYLDIYKDKDLSLNPGTPDNANIENIKGFYANVTALDEQFGRIINFLENENLFNNTIVLFTADHGELLYNNGPFGRKHQPHFYSVNIPFLISLPGRIPENRISDGLISIVDIMPTLLSFVGTDIPAGVDGINLSELLCGDDSASPDSVFINAPVAPHRWFEGWRGVVTKDYTYARFSEKSWCLFNDTADPYQQNNLAADNDQIELQKAMEEKLRYWLDKTNDPFKDSKGVEAEYYQEAVDGIMPFYEDEKIKAEKKQRLTAFFERN